MLGIKWQGGVLQSIYCRVIVLLETGLLDSSKFSDRAGE